MKIIKKDYQKKLVKVITVFLNKNKEKTDNMVSNDTKIYKKTKKKGLLSIEKIIKQEKEPIIVIIRSYYFKKQLLRKIF